MRNLIPLLLIFLLCSCSKKHSHPEGRPYRVALVHTYDALQESYERFNETIINEFKVNNLDVDLKISYLDIYKPQGPESSKIQSVLSGLKTQKPDLILLENNFAITSLFLTNDKLFHEVPVVIGNLHTEIEGETSAKTIIGNRNATGFVCPVDFKENILIASELSKNNLVEIELDHEEGENYLRKSLKESIKDDIFLDDTDFHDMALNYSDLHERLKDKIVVLAYSIKNPERNVCPDDTLYGRYNYGRKRTENMLSYSSYYPSLVIKKDLYSNTIALSTNLPQFTAVNVDFGNSNNEYAAGYLCPIENVAKDMANYAVRILKGENARSLPLAYHKQERVINWKALLIRNPEYSSEYNSLSKTYSINNVPFYVKHATLTLIAIILSVSLGVILIILFIYFLNERLQRTNKKLQEQLEYDREYGNLVFLGVKSTTFHYDQEEGFILGENTSDSGNIIKLPYGADVLNKAALMVNTEFLPVIEQIRESIKTEGNFNFILPIESDEEETHWLQLRYKVTRNEEGKLIANGLIINADETMAREKLLLEAKRKSQNSEMKDKFLRGMKANISKPLDKILEYSEILSEVEQSHTHEEYLETVKKLDQEGQNLMNIVNKILELVRMESGRVQLDMKPIQLKTFLMETIDRWKELHTPVTQFTLDKVDPKLFIIADKMRLIQMIDILFEAFCKNGGKGELTIHTKDNYITDEIQIIFCCKEITLTDEIVNNLKNRFEEQKIFDLSMGLDMNIANAIAWNMNGRLTLEELPDKVYALGVVLKMEEMS